MLKIRLFHSLLANLACLLYATQETPAATQEAISPETLAAMPPDVKDAPQPVGRNWTNAGMEIGQTILAAEQGIIIAEQNVVQTKISGLVELCQHGDTERAQFIAGVGSAFATKDGDKLTKGHQNYMADLRRVSTAIKNGNNAGDLVKMLEGEGKYADKMEKVPKASARGGSNAGTGAKAATEQVKAAIAEYGPEAVAEAVANLANPPTEPAPASAPTTTPAVQPEKAPVHAEFTTETLVKAILGSHEPQVEPILHAAAARCKLSQSPMYQELGALIERTLTKAEQKENEEPAKLAA